MEFWQRELAILFNTNKEDPYENFKKYMMSDTQKITEEYLWDYLQRPNILFENGVNIFIFENNKLLCPKEQNVNYYYDINKKTILIIKSKEYYEPIYYLQGDGKTARSTCKMVFVYTMV